MIDVAKIVFKTHSIFDLTNDLSLIEKATGLNFTNSKEALFITKEEYLNSTVEESKIIAMFEFAETVLNQPDLVNYLKEKYAEKLDSFFNE